MPAALTSGSMPSLPPARVCPLVGRAELLLGVREPAGRTGPTGRLTCAHAEWDEEASLSAPLEALGIAPDRPVVVHWDARTAALTDWGTFAAHWGAFCYPSSDDVTVWEPGADWTLAYWHYEVIQFRQRDRAG